MDSTASDSSGNTIRRLTNIPGEKEPTVARFNKPEKESRHEQIAPRVEASVVRDPQRDSALTRAVQQIEKQFGKGAVMKLDGDAKATVDGIPTGSLSLD